MRSDEMAQRIVRYAQPALLVGLVFWLAVVSVLAFALARERQQALSHARQEVASLSAVVEEYTARTFDSVDLALSGLASYLGSREFPADDSSVRELMRARLKHLPTVRALFVIGPDGAIRHDTDFPSTPKVSLADRDYFRQYQQQPELHHALSPALQSRSGTGWFVASTRRITGSDGSFQGVVVAAVQLDWVSRLFTKLQLQTGQTLALLQADGRMLARYPPDDPLIGRSYAQQPVFAEAIPRSRAGVYEASGPPLGYPRLVSYRALETQPLVVVLTMPLSTVLATWYRTAAGALVALLVFTVITGAGVLFFLQRQAESRRAAAHRVERAQAQAVAQANAKFRTFFEQGCFFSCVLSLDGTVLEANDAGLVACGIAREQVVGRKFWECGWWGSGATQAGSVRDGVLAAAGGTTARSEAAYRLADGARMLVELAFSPIRDAAGTVLFVAALAVDITQRKLHEERLRGMADELANANRLKGEFLATLSHELRNVLAPLQNGVAILERVEPGSPPASRAREMLKKQLAQMRRLVDDLLDISRVNSGKVLIEKEPIDLREVLAASAEATRSFMDGPGHRFTTSWPDEAMPVDVDRARMQQVFTNLLSNAAKYTPPGGHIQLNARREGREVVVEVVDNGMGIPVAAQAKVFDMFEQVADNLHRAQGGLGIGLSLVQKLVALHGGHVEAFSEGSNLGSTFTVYLPTVDGLPQAQGGPVSGQHAADGFPRPA
jgi:PAS domain S-box-containing protein